MIPIKYNGIINVIIQLNSKDFTSFLSKNNKELFLKNNAVIIIKDSFKPGRFVFLLFGLFFKLNLSLSSVYNLTKLGTLKINPNWYVLLDSNLLKDIKVNLS